MLEKGIAYWWGMPTTPNLFKVEGPRLRPEQPESAPYLLLIVSYVVRPHAHRHVLVEELLLVLQPVLFFI